MYSYPSGAIPVPSGCCISAFCETGSRYILSTELEFPRDGVGGYSSCRRVLCSRVCNKTPKHHLHCFLPSCPTRVPPWV